MSNQKERNKKIDCIKLLAACFVVLIHIMFPGKLGITARSLARFAVPLFFCISGYYTYGIKAGAIKKRIIYIIELQIVASVIYGLWGMWKHVVIKSNAPLSYIKKVFSVRAAGMYVFDQVNPFATHLWYLAALMFCYIILMVYVVVATDEQGNIDYKNLYLIACSFFAVMIFMGSYLYIDKKQDIHYSTFRNALFTGFPFVMLGIFLRQYKDVLLRRLEWNALKGVKLIFLGLAASVLQEFAFGKTELPLGMLVVVPSIMLILISDDIAGPPISDTWSRILGDTSLIIYIVHVLINDILKAYKGNCLLIQKFFNHPYLYPCFIIVVSFLLGILYSLIKLAIQKNKQKRVKEC